MTKEEKLTSQNCILVCVDSFSGIIPKIELLTRAGKVWELGGIFDEDIGHNLLFGGIDYLEHHLNAVKNWHMCNNPDVEPCCGGEMIRSIFLQKEGCLIELGTFSTSYNVIYNYVDDCHVLGILNGLIANWFVFW